MGKFSWRGSSNVLTEYKWIVQGRKQRRSSLSPKPQALHINSSSAEFTQKHSSSSQPLQINSSCMQMPASESSLGKSSPEHLLVMWKRKTSSPDCPLTSNPAAAPQSSLLQQQGQERHWHSQSPTFLHLAPDQSALLVDSSAVLAHCPDHLHRAKRLQK